MYNNISDLKLFLVTISYELQLHCGDAVSVKFRNIVKLSQYLTNLWTIRPLGFYTNF